MANSKRPSTDKKEETKNEVEALDKALPNDTQRFFQLNPLVDDIPSEKVNKFLQHVVKGEQEDVEKMLKDNPSLAYKKGDVTDYSGRQFQGISGFQYALWALDTDMWKTMLPEKIEDTPNIAKEQLLEVEETGVTYIPPEPVTDEAKEELKKEDEEERKIIIDKLAPENKADPFLGNKNLMGIMVSYANIKIESHYDFKLIEALQAFIKHVGEIKERDEKWSNWTKEDWNKLDTFWQRVVGGAQRLVPVHIANQYCRTDSSFVLTPNKFNVEDEKENLKGRRTVNVFNKDILITDNEWFPLDQNLNKRLGVNIAIVKEGWGSGTRSSATEQAPNLARVTIDLEAIIALWKIRYEDLEKLMKQLDVSPKNDLDLR